MTAGGVVELGAVIGGEVRGGEVAGGECCQVRRAVCLP